MTACGDASATSGDVSIVALTATPSTTAGTVTPAVAKSRMSMSLARRINQTSPVELPSTQPRGQSPAPSAGAKKGLWTAARVIRLAISICVGCSDGGKSLPHPRDPGSVCEGGDVLACGGAKRLAQARILGEGAGASRQRARFSLRHDQPVAAVFYEPTAGCSNGV